MYPRLQRLSLIILASFACAIPAFSEALKDWQALIFQGRNAEEAGKYTSSIAAFSKAVALARAGGLPAKCLPISLCRQIRSELLFGQANAAEPLFNQLVALAEKQKRDNTFDPEVGVWMADVADTYMSKKIAAPAELKIKHSNRLKMLAIDVTKKEYVDSLMTLARFYIENGQLDDGVRILVRIEAANESKTKRNDLPDILYREAVRCRVLQKFEPAKQITKIAIEKAKAGASTSRANSVPAYICFMGLCALAEHKDQEAQKLLKDAIKEGRNSVSTPNKRLVKSELLTLVPTIKSDELRNKLPLAAAEYIFLLTAQQEMFSDDLPEQYLTLSLLTNTLANDHKYPQLEHYLKQSVTVAQLPQSCVQKDLSDLYMRLGIAQALENKTDESNDSFSKALELDGSHAQFHSALTLLWWGFHLNSNKRYGQAETKLTKAIQLADTLPIDRRGTIAADALQILSFIQIQNGNRRGAEASLKQSTAEIQQQKQIHSKLGPDIYHRVGS